MSIYSLSLMFVPYLCIVYETFRIFIVMSTKSCQFIYS